MAIRAVISDFGGVMTTPLLGAFLAFQDETGISGEALGRAMQRIAERAGEHPLFELERGRLTESEFLDLLRSELAPELGHEPELHRFSEIYFEALDPNQPMIDLMRDLKARGLWNQDMLDRLKYYDGELGEVEEIPADIKAKYFTAYGIDYNFVIAAAARRQKWIDQSQSVNLWIATPDLKTLSHMYRAAWRSGLKTTYYLRSTGASNIEKATISVAKEVRIGAVEAPKQHTEEEKMVCSIEARRLGIECEACQ
jgi:hypothetical protein